MTRFLPYSERPELPSSAETWSILLGAIAASILLVSAFRLAGFARTPLADDESAYRSLTPVIGAAPAKEAPRAVVVRPEPRAAARRRHHHHARPQQPVATVVTLAAVTPRS